jgi:hypothetical protein
LANPVMRNRMYAVVPKVSIVTHRPPTVRCGSRLCRRSRRPPVVADYWMRKDTAGLSTLESEDAADSQPIPRRPVLSARRVSAAQPLGPQAAGRSDRIFRTSTDRGVMPWRPPRSS